MDDLADRFLELIHGLEEVRDAITPERAQLVRCHLDPPQRREIWTTEIAPAL